MELMHSSESESQFHRLESGTVYSLAKDPFSLSSLCCSFTTPGTLVLGLGRGKISGYFAEISAPDGSSVDDKDFDGNLSPLLLRHTPKPRDQRIKRKRTQVERSERRRGHHKGKRKQKNTVILDRTEKIIVFLEILE